MLTNQRLSLTSRDCQLIEGRKLNDDTASAIISDRKVIRKKTKARMERKNFVSRRRGRNENYLDGFHLTSQSETRGCRIFILL